MRSNRTIRYFKSYIRQLPHLNLKEKDVLLGRLRKFTHNKIGIKFGVTEGRIRQIEMSGIRKLKSQKWQLSLFKKQSG